VTTYASRRERQAEVTSAEEYLLEGPTDAASVPGDSAALLEGTGRQCSWCGLPERSHSAAQLRGCRQRLSTRQGGT
jgi:hypothetical protein